MCAPKSRRLAEWQVHRLEWRSMLLSTLSHRAKRIVHFTYLLDIRGTSFAHRKCLPYVKELIVGLAHGATNEGKKSVTFILGMTAAAKTIFAFTLRKMVREHQKDAICMCSINPFETAMSFCRRFRPEAIPADFGGEPVLWCYYLPADVRCVAFLTHVDITTQAADRGGRALLHRRRAPAAQRRGGGVGLREGPRAPQHGADDAVRRQFHV